jgi:hypothetical protein
VVSSSLLGGPQQHPSNRLTWCTVQGKWGYRRVLAAFGSGYLLPNGEHVKKLTVCNDYQKKAAVMINW